MAGVCCRALAGWTANRGGGGALRLLPRLSAAVRFAVWGLAFALVAAMPLLRFETGWRRAVSAGAVHVGAGWAVAVALVWAGMSLARAGQLVVQAVAAARSLAASCTCMAGDEILELLRNAAAGGSFVLRRMWMHLA